MLELYSEVSLKTPVVIDYILCEISGNNIIFYPDIYKMNDCVIEGERVEFYSLYNFLLCRLVHWKGLLWR